MKKISLFLFVLTTVICQAQTFRISIADSLSAAPLDGRLLLLLSKTNNKEPRFLVDDAANTQMREKAHYILSH